MQLLVSGHSPLNRPYMVPYKTNVDMVEVLDFCTYPNILHMSAVAQTVPFYLSFELSCFHLCTTTT